MDTTTSPGRRRGAAEGPQAPPRRRADAERNIAAILDAAVTCFCEQPQVSMADIARAAGVGRVTLYAHFPSREVLLDAVVAETIVWSGSVIEASRLDEGPADEALRRLLRTSWQILDRHRRLFEVARRELGPARLREHHDPAMSHVQRLLERGRDEEAFRTDLPLSWLITTVYTLLHAAAEEVNAGTLATGDAAHVLEATLLPALAVPAA